MSIHSNDSRQKQVFQEKQNSQNYKNSKDFHHLSIPEFSNVNLYNQKKPFLKKNSIHTPDSFDPEKTTPDSKKHFEYGTPLANDSQGIWKPPSLKGSFKRGASRPDSKNTANRHMIRAHELNKLENKYQNVLYENNKKPISHFTLQEGKAHQSLIDNRIHEEFRAKNSRGSKKNSKVRSKSRTNWSKQRLRKELEKFDEEIEDKEEDLHAQSLQHQEDFYRRNIEKRERKLGQRKSKRSSMKAIAQSYHQGMGSIHGRKKKSRNTSRKSKRTKKGHNRRVSSQLDETPKTNQYQQKMTRSQVRPIYAKRQIEEEFSRQKANWNMNVFDQGNTPRNPDFVDRRREYKMRQMRSSREMDRVAIEKRVRQSYEQNYIPDQVEYEEHWRRTQQQNHPQMHPHQYISKKEEKPKMNFDYGNLNANVRMHLPFE